MNEYTTDSAFAKKFVPNKKLYTSEWPNDYIECDTITIIITG